MEYVGRADTGQGGVNLMAILENALKIVNREMLKTSERFLELTVLKMALEKRAGYNNMIETQRGSWKKKNAAQLGQH